MALLRFVFGYAPDIYLSVETLGTIVISESALCIAVRTTSRTYLLGGGVPIGRMVEFLTPKNLM